ncbi:MAG: EamA family transporter [Acidobacteriota bacterium]
MSRAGVAVIWAALTLIWGSTWLFIKLGVQDIPPLTFSGVRFFLAMVPLGLFIVVRGLPLPSARSDWRLLAGTGLFSFSVSYSLVCWAEIHIASGLTAVLFTTFPLFGQVFAHLYLPSEPFRARKVLGVVLGIAGVGMIFWDQVSLEGPMALWGSLAVVLSAAVSAVSGVFVKRQGGHLDAAVLSFWQMAFGLIPLVAGAWLVEGNPLNHAWGVRAWISIVYLAFVGTSLAFVLWYRLIQAIEVTKAQVMPLFNTLVAVVLGWLLMGETYGAVALGGGAVVLAGTALALSGPRPAPAER